MIYHNNQVPSSTNWNSGNIHMITHNNPINDESLDSVQQLLIRSL